LDPLCYHHLADTALTWKDLYLSQTYYDFLHAMIRVFPNRLDLIDSGLSDDFLDIERHLCRLYVEGCLNITVEVLKNMVTFTEQLKKTRMKKLMTSGYFGHARPPGGI